MSGEGSRQLKEMFKPRQVPEQTAADAADTTAAAATAHAPAAAPPDTPAAAAADVASGGASTSVEFATPAPKIPSPATPQTADGPDSAGTNGPTDGAETNAATPSGNRQAPDAGLNSTRAVTAAEMAAGAAARDARASTHPPPASTLPAADAAAAAAEASVAAQAEAEAKANAQAAAEESAAAETTEAEAEATATAKSKAAAAAVARAADAGDQGSPFALPGRNLNRDTDTAQHLREPRLRAPHIRPADADSGTGRLPDGDQRRSVSPAAH